MKTLTPKMGDVLYSSAIIPRESGARTDIIAVLFN